MLKQTKIICTLGPKTFSEERIESLIKSGMNIARLNFSHGTHKEYAVVIERIKKIRKKLGLPIGIILDTKGPEIRLGKIVSGEKKISRGDSIWLTKQATGNDDEVSLSPECVLDSLKEGMQLLIDDGYISANVIQCLEDRVKISFNNSGTLKSLKSVSVQCFFIDLPFLTDKDIVDIKFGIEHEVDFIAASFVRCAQDVRVIKNLLKDKPWIQVISKIENQRGIENFEEILDVSEGIMVARGDLGIELSIVKVPGIQKKILKLCREKGKFSITATQMLESMINNPFPTRAEVSDVSNAIYDGSSAVMLSGETASGNYPVETVSMMNDIIRETEKNLDMASFISLPREHLRLSVSKSLLALGSSCMDIAEHINAKAIIIHTIYGGTVRVLSCYRSEVPIIAITPDIHLFYTLSVQWGIIPLFLQETDNAVWRKAACQYAVFEGIIGMYDNVLVLSRNFSLKETNALTLHVVANVLEDHNVLK